MLECENIRLSYVDEFVEDLTPIAHLKVLGKLSLPPMQPKAHFAHHKELDTFKDHPMNNCRFVNPGNPKENCLDAMGKNGKHKIEMAPWLEDLVKSTDFMIFQLKKYKSRYTSPVTERKNYIGMMTHEEALFYMDLDTSSGFPKSQPKSEWLAQFHPDSLRIFWDALTTGNMTDAIPVWSNCTKEEPRDKSKVARSFMASNIFHTYVGIRLFGHFHEFYHDLNVFPGFTTGTSTFSGELWRVIKRIKPHSSKSKLIHYDAKNYDVQAMNSAILDSCKRIRAALIDGINMVALDWYYDNIHKRLVVTAGRHLVEVENTQPSGSQTTMVDNDLGHKLWLCCVYLRVIGFLHPDFFKSVATFSDDGVAYMDEGFLDHLPFPVTAHTCDMSKDNPNLEVEFLGKTFVENKGMVFPVPVYLGKFLSSLAYCRSGAWRDYYSKLCSLRTMWYFSPTEIVLHKDFLGIPKGESVKIINIIECVIKYIMFHYSDEIPVQSMNQYFTPHQIEVMFTGFEPRKAYLGSHLHNEAINVLFN